MLYQHNHDVLCPAIHRSSLACEMKIKDQTSVILPVLCQLYAREFEPSGQGA